MLQPAIAGITAPVVAVVAAIGILIAAFVTLWNTNEEFRNKITEIFGQVQEAVSNFVSELAQRFEAIQPIISGFIEFFKNIWLEFCNFIAPIFIDAFSILSQLLQTIFDTIIGVLDIFIGIFTGDWNRVWNGAKQIFVSIWNFLVSTFNTIVSRLASIVSSMVQSVTTFFGNLLSNIIRIITSIFSSISTWAVNMANKAREAGRNFLTNVINFLSQLPGRLAQIISNIISRLTQWVSQMRQKGTDGARSLFNAVVNGLASLPSKMMSVGREIVNGVWRGIQNARDHFYSSVKGFFSNIVSAAKGALGISSPSKVFEEEVGENIPPGAERGIKKAMPALIKDTVKDFNSMVNKVSDSLNPISIDSAVNTVKASGAKSSDFARQSSGGLFTEENLQMLAEMFYGLIKDAPIVNNVNVSMEDGDVLLDSERVGRKIAPVVSRVQATGNV